MQTTLYILLGVLLAFLLALVSTMPVGASGAKYDHDQEAAKLFMMLHQDCSDKAYEMQETGQFLHSGRILYLQCMALTYENVHGRVVEIWESENKHL